MRILRLNNLCQLLITALAVVCCTSCIKDTTDTAQTAGMITVGYTIDGMQAGTYSTPAEGHELAVNDVHILFYEMGETEGGGNLAGGYITYQHATLTHGTSTFSFPLPDALVPKTDYRTIIIGNAHSFVPGGFASFDAYLNACKSMTYKEAKQKIYAELTGNTMPCLPMWGKLVDGTGAEIPFRFESKTSATITGTIHLSRSVCRLDLKNHAANSLNIAWVKVCNFRSKGYYFHNDSPYGEVKSGLTSALPSGAGDGYVRVAEASNGVQELKAGLYAFPNIVPIVAQNDDLTTYLMIAGYYQDGSETPNTSKLTYYRFNMAELGNSQVLKRNNIYRASIMSVKGAGADTEQGAKDETSPLLEYQVDDEWTDDEDNTATDGYGNFLIVSRTQVTFSEGVKDATEVVKVKVKEGMTWEVIADHAPSDRGEAFSFTKSGASSFSITTLLDNASEDVNNGRLKVVATTTQGTMLEIQVSLMQLSSSSEMKILLVDNRTGTIEKRLPGTGGTLSLQVQTGSSYAGWTAEDYGNSMGTWSGSSFTGAGADKGILTIVASPNITPMERTATIIVHRAGAADVTINLTQPKSDKLLSITPMPANGLLTVEGFDSRVGNPNGISVKKEFWVTLADPNNYTITATADFDGYHDLILTQEGTTPNTPTFPGKKDGSIITGMLNGEKFTMNVYRTAPGDPTIKGTITVKAVPKKTGWETQEISFSVHIVTSCTIGDVVRGSLLIADRNVGALPRMNEAEGFMPALNFTNLPNIIISGYPYSDGQNTQFKGDYFNFATASAASFCPLNFADKNVDDKELYSPYYKRADRTKWHMPTSSDGSVLMAGVAYSKLRPYIISEVKDKNGNFVGCFLPIAGNSETPNRVTGYYQNGVSNGYMVLDTKSIYVAGGGSSVCNVRCVRNL